MVAAAEMEVAVVPVVWLSILAVGIHHCPHVGCKGVEDHRASGETKAAGKGRGPGGGKGLGARTFFRGVTAPGLKPMPNSAIAT